MTTIDTAVAVHPALTDAADAAMAAWSAALRTHDRQALSEHVALGADGTPTSRMDELVERAVLDALDRHDVNILSEEAGHLDRGADVTVAIDPVDGTGNAVTGLPISAFTAAIAIDGRFTQALTRWFHTGETWTADRDVPSRRRTSGRRSLDGALVSMIRPKADAERFLAISRRADRVRVLGSTSLECAWVADGALDAFCDPGSDTHRIVDLAAAVVLVEAAGGAVIDAYGRPVEFTTDIAGRWSGIAAATPDLAAEIADLLQG
jgi:myo-inositol-1(or 4)-monophosphatase